MSHPITLTPYDPVWPELFAEQAALIHEALQENGLAVHHVGSTAVPGLAAKPKIDIIAVVHDGPAAIAPLEQAGFDYKGE